ncbi:ABC transporter permease [Mycoplasmopsis columbinasalis]|uniref:Spermidine/putrescine ABC transporter membrane protein n=1 Tax=Mycoplasmopsis columbinasalis TaxID=114880 RepID=A0A449BAS2_9BACT|nr:ABC transporter permease subunit [Mycoplasmopsis columbinasalis]VEU78267.1 spermidine/putrescine ABC transporter membrane protein [Mycoplasmopsis columbinasalis]
MNRFFAFLKHSYVYLILIFTYIPLLFAVIFSFNKPSEKGFLSFSFNSFSNDAYNNLFADGRDTALLNSFIIALCTAILVVSISLVTVYAMWKQRNKKYGAVVKSINNIPLINPDNITAIGLVLVFSILFGSLAATSEGLFRGIVGHAIMALPYGVTLMYPRSEKFNRSLLEASQDLGYNKFKSWFKTYFVYMLPVIIFAGTVAAILSFDDFIILRTITNTSTLGTKLYEGEFQVWALALGSVLMFITIAGNAIYIWRKAHLVKKAKKIKNAQKKGGHNE